jgi:glutaredoxin-like YruB-family protein
MNTQKKVIVYSTPSCSYCVYTKNFLKEKGVLFEDVDVSANYTKALEMIDKSGQMGVPVVDIAGEVIVGFQPEVFSQLLNLAT